MAAERVQVVLVAVAVAVQVLLVQMAAQILAAMAELVAQATSRELTSLMQAAAVVAEIAIPPEQAELAVAEMEAAEETNYQRKELMGLVAVAELLAEVSRVDSVSEADQELLLSDIQRPLLQLIQLRQLFLAQLEPGLLCQQQTEPGQARPLRIRINGSVQQPLVVRIPTSVQRQIVRMY
jgi:hypothetical protein